MTTSLATIDMEQILATRLDLTQREKTAIREALDLVDGKIKVALATIGQRPKETEEELVAALKERERLHSITPQNNVEERQFMRELESLRQKKKYVQQYTVQQAALDELKTRRTVLSKELREKERAIEELSTGIKKLKLAAIVGCSTSDIVEQKFTVPESRMAQVIGKGGSNLRSVEAEFNVSIDTDRTGGGLRIMGTEKAIATAHAAVLTTVNTITEELNLREEAVVCLILDKAALSQEIQTRYNVRLDISRAKKMFKIIGLPESILAAKRDIAAIDCAREQVAIDARVLPFIVGKGGATIRALGDNHRVQIDIVREKNTIDVLGFRDDVRTVAALLRDIVDENLEVEERILVHKNIMLGCIVGTGGQIVRNLQKELNVQLKVEKEEKGATDCLVIRGNTAKVFNAKLHINGLIEEYIGNTETVHVEDEYLPIIVGKKGSRIKAIREEHPEAVIDIEDNSVQIHCKDAATRAAVRQAIEDILAANHVRVVKVTSDVIILMKGQKCADLRSVLTGGELSLGMDILAEDNTIRLRGTREKADRGAAIIEAFQIANNSEVFHVNDEDCSVLLTGGSDAPIKALETEFSVEIHVLKKDSTVRLRGPAESIRAAKEALQSLLSGDLSRGSFLLTVDPIAFSSIIGKGGATHRKMEADHNVKIDLLKSCNQIRIRGTPEEVAAAKMVIVEFLDDVRTTSKMEVPEPAAGIVAAPLNPEQLEKVVKTAASLYHVEIDNDDGLLILKGHLKFVEEAKRYLTEHIQGSAVCKLQILGYQLDEIKPHTDTKLLAIEQKHRVKIELEESPPAIAISGATHHVDNAKIELFRFLDTMFPAEFASVAMTSDCLREVGASRTLLEITDIAGNVFLSVDRPLSCIRIRGDAAAVATAVAMIRDRLSLWQGRHAHVDIEEYMLPTIVGKNGVAIMALQKECGVSIHINRDLMRLEIQGSDQETVRSAVAKVAEIAMRLRTGFWETKLELDLVGLVIGKQGANVKKLRSETGATIDIDPRTCIIKISGDEEKVKLARSRVEEFIREQRRTSCSAQIRIPSAAFSLVIGPKGAKAQEIQQASGAKFDLDRTKNMGIVKGTPEACQTAIDLVIEILENEGYGPQTRPKILSAEEQSAAASASAAADKVGGDEDNSTDRDDVEASDNKLAQRIKIPLGASPQLIAQLQQQEKAMGLSKSAAKRMRKKEQQPSSSPVPPSTSTSTSNQSNQANQSKQSTQSNEKSPIDFGSLRRRAVVDDDEEDDDDEDDEDDEEDEEEEEEEEELNDAAVTATSTPTTATATVQFATSNTVHPPATTFAASAMSSITTSPVEVRASPTSLELHGANGRDMVLSPEYRAKSQSPSVGVIGRSAPSSRPATPPASTATVPAPATPVSVPTINIQSLPADATRGSLPSPPGFSRSQQLKRAAAMQALPPAQTQTQAANGSKAAPVPAPAPAPALPMDSLLSMLLGSPVPVSTSSASTSTAPLPLSTAGSSQASFTSGSWMNGNSSPYTSSTTSSLSDVSHSLQSLGLGLGLGSQNPPPSAALKSANAPISASFNGASPAAATAGSGANYFKSKSGFTVRL